MLHKNRRHSFRTSLSSSVLICAALMIGCAEEGSAEKVGRKIDEVMEEIKHGDEGPLEKVGRKTDEALAQMKDSLEEEIEKVK